MPVVNALAREVVFKIVYYGPGLGGKTTSLQHVHATTKPEHRGKMVSLATPVDRTLYFDFLPIRVPNLKDLTVRLQLFTVPGQVYYNATRKLVLTGADGVVLVVDSQRVRAEANLESLRNLHENLEEQGRQLDETPHILQYNKRDLPDLISIEELEQRLNPHAAPSFASVATIGEGVYEALEAITRAVLEDFENRMPEHRELVMGQLMVPEGGLADALRQTEVDLVEVKPKPVLHLDFSAVSTTGDVIPAAQTNTDMGEEVARLAAEPGTRPGVGSLEQASVPWAASTTFQDSASVPDLVPARNDQSWSSIQGFSLSRMWPHADRELVRSAEGSLARCDWVSAVTHCGQLVKRTLAAVAHISVEPSLIESPAVCCILLGVDGRKYLEFQRLLTSVLESCVPSEHEALKAFAFAISVLQARATLASE
jgi:signal recognition particle receptor subunit beta